MSRFENLTLWYWPTACSLACHIVLEETGLPYKEIKVDFASGAQRQPDYLSINPKGRVPALQVADGILTETPAILTYLAPAFRAALGQAESDALQSARELEFMCWLASTVHVAFAHISRAERYATSPEAQADVKRKGAESCRPLWQEIEAKLQGREWAMGERYSVLDPYLQVFWNWGKGERLGYDMEADFPVWTAHARRLCSRPAVSRVYARAGLVAP
ncbi:glutathione S-transferase family protein [Allorhizobium terrae]|uniref:Glutathione S-transferase n=1 Tax=Allorhizobium terrae TaxID=1848972 RepID=A0A4S3ZTZ1_9HYPH|nr:glutathione S-transferase N-terminal domain-containing protein [Allorhizobium terrae]THF49220.1 glutathione S-transferase [Allorhizobium terrae]TWD44812.1 glutathione S-transferase [Agrobacterium vitis]